MDGCSVQYAENSVRDVVPKMKGGAVKDERSPLKDAIDYRLDTISKFPRLRFLVWGGGIAYFQKRRPGAFILRCNTLTFRF